MANDGRQISCNVGLKQTVLCRLRWPLACKDRGFESRRRLWYVCCECCVSLRRADHSSREDPTVCGVSECDDEASINQ
jgi:hypothetical protein